MKKISKKTVIFIGIIVLVIGMLSLYLIYTPKKVTRVEELKAEQIEKEKIKSERIPTKKGQNDNTIIMEKEDLFLEDELIPLIINIIDYENISYNDKTGYIFIKISPETLAKYGENETMWGKLGSELTEILKKNENENPNGNKYEILVKEINKDEKSLLRIIPNEKPRGDYISDKEEKASSSIEEIDEDAYLGKRVIFNKNLNDSLVLVKTNLDTSGVYTDEIAQALKELALLIEDYYLENTPTEKYTESEGALRAGLKLIGETANNLPIAMQDKDIEKMTELIEKMNNGFLMFEVSNISLTEKATEE